MKALWSKVMADKAKFALIIIAAILVLQLIGILIVVCISVAQFGESRVPTEMWDLVRTTITLLIGAASSMYLNGKSKESKESKDAAQTTSGKPPRIPL